MVDSAMFPRLTRYAAGLPQGLKSYPQDRAKASLCRGMLDTFPFDADEIAALPAELRFIAEGAVPVASC